MKKEYQREKSEVQKRASNKIEKRHQQIRQGSYYICTIYDCCLYQHSVRLFYDQKYTMHDPVISFNVISKYISVKHATNIFLKR